MVGGWETFKTIKCSEVDLKSVKIKKNCEGM